MCICVPLSLSLSRSLARSLARALFLACSLSLSLCVLHTTITQLKVLGEVTESDPYVNPIDEQLEAEMIRDLNDKWDNKVNPFQ
jgi:hypothetical protein